MEATETPTLSLDVRVEIARHSLTDLRRWLARWDRWMRACDLLAAGDDSAWRRQRPPSKDSKHRAYGAAGHIMRCLPDLAVERPSTVDGLRAVVAAFEGRYGR